MKAKKEYGFKLKYCTRCNSAWEVSSTSGEAGRFDKHPDFPSFGLEREDCPECKGTSPEDADTPATMAQKAAMEHQELFIKHVKKQSK